MRIGIDATCWGNKRGFGRFTRELLEAMIEIDKANEYVFFIDGHTSETDAIPSSVQKISANTKASQLKAASADGRRSLSDLWSMSRHVLQHKIDLFFFPAVYSYFPVFNRTKIIVTLHDVIADHNPELVFPNFRSKLFWKLKQNTAIRQADIVLTVSEYSKAQIVKYFGLPESRMKVISEGVRSVFRVLEPSVDQFETLRRFNLHENGDFLLYVGGISPHKNLDTLIAAFKRIVKLSEQSKLKLVLVGDYEDDPFFSAYPTLKKHVFDLELDEKVIFTGFIPDEELAHFYNAAALLVFPSLEEGFGLPAIEAMACGTPVAASNSSSLPEVIGSAGRFFDPHDPNDMADTIVSILESPDVRRTMRASSLTRAKDFQWKKAAQDTLGIFEELTHPDGRKAP